MMEVLVQLDPLAEPRRRARRNALAATAAIAGAFALAVAGVMMFRFLRSDDIDPLTAGTLVELKQQLVASPEDETLRGRLREVDRQIRHGHFEQKRFFVAGAWMLLAASLISLACARVAARMSARPYVPPEAVNAAVVGPARARLGILAGGTAIAAAVVILAVVSIRHEPEPQLTQSPPPPLPAATDEQLARAWLNFRGPGGIGIAPPGDYPSDWDGTSGKAIIWKAAIPLPGNNSPVVFEDNLLLSGADGRKREVYCFDAKTGQIRWTRPVGPKAGAVPKIMEMTGFAPSTVACDGQRVYAVFPTGDLACFDLNGNPLWSKSSGVPDSQYGFATSLICHKDRLILQLDQGTAGTTDKSALICYDGQSGNVLWRTARPVPASWTSPAIINQDGEARIITAADPWVIAYNAETGAEIWRADCLHGDVAPSPAFANGVVFVCQDGANIAAIRADGRGDVTTSHILWKDPEAMPDIVSPLAAGELVYRVKTEGALICADAKTGEIAWREDLEGPFHASPILVGGNIYLLNARGRMFIFEAGRAWKQIAAPAIDDQTNATPAFSNGRIYIRGEKTLYCVGEK